MVARAKSRSLGSSDVVGIGSEGASKLRISSRCKDDGMVPYIASIFNYGSLHQPDFDLVAAILNAPPTSTETCYPNDPLEWRTTAAAPLAL